MGDGSDQQPELPRPLGGEVSKNPQKLLDTQDQKMNASYIAALANLKQEGLEKEPVLGWKDMEGIAIDNDRIARMAQLFAKYAEYSERLLKDQKMTMPPTGIGQIDSWYKREIIRRIILGNGEVNITALSRAIKRVTDSEVDTGRFDSACGVIEGYIRNGGMNMVGGTGLRQS